MRKIVINSMWLWLVIMLSTAFGQNVTGSIGGIVQDPSKALMPGVSITMTNTATGVVATQVSNESGAYSFQSVLPGTYKLSASLPGFKTSVANDLIVGTTAQVRWDFTLQVGEVSSQVDVSVSGQQLLTESQASVGEVLSTQRARDLPLVSQNVLDLVRIMPGFQIDPVGQQFSVMAGLPVNTINTTMDGVSVTSGRNNNGIFSVTTINPDLVGEIKVILSPVDAEVGRGNGQIQIQTKSGTNKYTGSAVWNIRNSSLNANTWSNNRTIDPLTGQWSPTRLDWRNSNQYTVSYGGPIIRNKTFFFVLWDQNITNTRQLISTTVLTDTARNGVFRYWDGWNSGNALTPIPPPSPTATSGTYPGVDYTGAPLRPAMNINGSPYTGSLRCFSVFGNVKFDGSPFTQTDCPDGVAVLNNAPWDPLRPTADTTGYLRKFIDAMPRANYFASGTTDGLNTAVHRFLRTRKGNTGAAAQNGQSPELVNRKQINIKIDEQFSKSHRLNVGWSYQLDDSADNLANWPNSIQGESNRRPVVLTMNLTSTLSATLLNEARFGLSKDKIEVVPPWYSANDSVRKEAEAWLIQGGAGSNGTPYKVAFTPGTGSFAFPTGVINYGSTYSGSDSPLYNFADTVSWTHGTHALRVGAEIRLTRSNGWSGAVFPTATGGNGGNIATTLNNGSAALGLDPATYLATTRGNAANMLYLLAGSVNSTTTSYWIASDENVKNGTWEDWSTTNGKRLREQVANEFAVFWKDDWKIKKSLTLNLGLRYERYLSPYLRGGYTAAVVDGGYGLFGAARTTGDPFSTWLLQPGAMYLEGYGSNAGANALQCTTGTTNPTGIPVSSCDPNKLTKIEFVGPESDHPNKTVIPNDANNFGPAVGFAWTLPWFGAGKTTIRGGYQVTFGGAGLRTAGGLENTLGNIPGNSSTATLNRADIPDPVLSLANFTTLIPVKPTAPAVPGGDVPIYNHNAGFTAYDPTYATPYTTNLTFSVTRAINRYVTLDMRYVGVLGRKREGTYNLNVPNVYYNKELFDALEVTRRGENSPLFDQMFAGLNMSGQTTGGYGAVGTCVTGAPTGASGLGQEGCSGNAVMQHGSAHLRRNAVFSANLANGNYVAVANSLATISSGTGLTLQPLPTGLPNVSGRVVRNGCDRLANGLTSIPTRCFPENYIHANPQLGTPTVLANLADSNYHSLQTQIVLRPIHGMSSETTYTWSKLLGDMPGGWNDPLHRRLDYTMPFQNATHDFRFNSVLELPIGPNKFFLGNSSGWLARAVERWQTGLIFNWTSGNPRTVPAGAMTYAGGQNTLDNGQRRSMIVSPLYNPSMSGHASWKGDTGLYYGDNWVRVVDPQCQVMNVTDSMGYNMFTDNRCDLNAVALKNGDGTTGPILLQNPLPGQMGNHPLSLSETGKWRFDANLSKTFRFSESKSVQIRFDAVNVLNHPDLTQVEPMTVVFGNINSDTQEFGRIVTKQGLGAGSAPRSFNGSIRLNF
jgi:Carboxypeptidase regulatory-like domain/TonB-dependent Receptor Plug Domain